TMHVAGEGWAADVPLDATEIGSKMVDVYINELVGMTKEISERIMTERVSARRAELSAERAKEFEEKRFVYGEHELRYKERVFGEAPPGGHSLWISMHGGGGAPPEVNDQQWENQIGLYEPAEGIYIAPRAPGNTWDLWHTPQVDPLFQRLIESFVAARNVNPNRVYLMGYSAGGDGVYQLAPRMADRFAAAAMMAGHPNETKPDGLRNLPFAIFMGGKDAAYDRNKIAQRFGDQLAALREADPEGYTCLLKIYPEHAHWMNGDDKEALPWMAEKTRNPWPKRIVWLQDNVTHERFYWLQVAPEDARGGRRIVALVDGQKIHIESPETNAVTLLLSDELLDLDQPIEVFANGALVFRGKAERRPEVYEAFFETRFDPAAFPMAKLALRWLPKK
ncbi:MAG: dienelactone hydrolase family protein, partial [Planctomycetota bacterium]